MVETGFLMGLVTKKNDNNLEKTKLRLIHIVMIKNNDSRSMIFRPLSNSMKRFQYINDHILAIQSAVSVAYF